MIPPCVCVQGHVGAMARDEWGHLALITALSVVDDTTLLRKMVVSELQVGAVGLVRWALWVHVCDVKLLPPPLLPAAARVQHQAALLHLAHCCQCMRTLCIASSKNLVPGEGGQWWGLLCEDKLSTGGLSTNVIECRLLERGSPAPRGVAGRVSESYTPYQLPKTLPSAAALHCTDRTIHACLHGAPCPPRCCVSPCQVC